RRRPEYSTMKARFLIGSVAKRPSPVRERPTRKGLRGIGGSYTWIRKGANDCAVLAADVNICVALPYRCLLMLALRHVHDHPREQIEARFDRIDVDVFGVVRMRAEAAQPEALDDGRLGLQRGKRRVGAAAFGDIADDEIHAELGIDALPVSRQRLRAR